MSAQSPPGSAARRRSRAIRPRQVLALLLTVLAVVFIAQNRDRVQVSLFTIDVSAPVWLLLVVMTVIGIVLGLLLGRSRK
jgi:putative membrane protein